MVIITALNVGMVISNVCVRALSCLHNAPVRTPCLYTPVEQRQKQRVRFATSNEERNKGGGS